MAKIDKVNPMCGCVMPVVPTIFSDGCLTLPEQVNKLTYKVFLKFSALTVIIERIGEIKDKGSGGGYYNLRSLVLFVTYKILPDIT